MPGFPTSAVEGRSFPIKFQRTEPGFQPANAKIPRMKRLILLCFLATLLTAQSAPEVEITAEPHHHLTFENKSVRVFNVEVPPNEATEMHWHRHDYIAVTLAPAEISNAVKDTPPVMVKFTGGDARFAPATFAHVVRTTSPQPFRNVTVEILEDATLRNSPSPWDAGNNPDSARRILQGGTRQVLFVKDGIRVSETELEPGGVIPLHHHIRPHMLVAVTDVELRSDEEGQPPTTDHFKSGDVKWIPGGFSHTLTNTSTKPEKYVTLEFP